MIRQDHVELLTTAYLDKAINLDKALGPHYSRLRASWSYFHDDLQYKHWPEPAWPELLDLVSRLDLEEPLRTRITYDQNGKYHLSHSNYTPLSSYSIAIDSQATTIDASHQHWVLYKTTERALYSQARDRVASLKVDDVVLHVEQGDRHLMTETSIANIALQCSWSEARTRGIRFEQEGKDIKTPWFTPCHPVDGRNLVSVPFLNGLMRQSLLAGRECQVPPSEWLDRLRGKLVPAEIPLEALVASRDRLVCFNALRGAWKVELLAGA